MFVACAGLAVAIGVSALACGGFAGVKGTVVASDIGVKGS